MSSGARSIINSETPNITMCRSTKVLLAGALALGVAGSVLVYKWSRHKEGDRGAVMVVQQEQEKPALQAPVRADAGVERPEVRPETEEAPEQRKAPEKRTSGKYGRGKGLPYEKSEARKRLEEWEALR